MCRDEVGGWVEQLDNEDGHCDAVCGGVPTSTNRTKGKKERKKSANKQDRSIGRMKEKEKRIGIKSCSSGA